MSRKLIKREDESLEQGFKINSNLAAILLKRAYLDGLIGDCVVLISSTGRFTINAIDITNSVFVSCSEKVSKNLEDKEIGVGDLKMLVGIFSSEGEENVEIDFIDDDARILIKRPKKRGVINYLLKDTELVSTAFKGSGDPYKKLLDICKSSVTLTAEKRKDVMFLTKTLSISETRKIQLICKKKIVSLIGGLDTGHKFNIEIGRYDGKGIEKSLSFNAEYLTRILDVLEGDVELYFGDGAPLLVAQDKKNFWSLSEETVG